MFTKDFISPRLILRSPQTSMAPALLDFVTRNREFFRKWIPVEPLDKLTHSETENRISADQISSFAGTGYKFVIYAKENQGRIIGHVDFSQIIYGPFLSCYLGYKMDKDENGKGYLTEALRTLIPWIFDEIKLHRIEANIMPRNLASIRVVERLGFVNEGIARQYLKINGVWEDHAHYVLINDDSIPTGRDKLC